MTMTVAEKIIRAVREHPGLTERQLADRIFGENAAIQRVNPTCRKLVTQGLLLRQGKGWSGDPFRYHPATRPR
ncbi:hypothetical protein [Bradyrhizobium sp. RD5-C2]|uniref:hypothetical protein n=1 Tax=Bradyrhizobium sp. RD5-C2 TaxID=244562 RepID=UPI001CC4945F|nr:hypothetical protein [Bradyrhizobium sp. RD5-C2]